MSTAAQAPARVRRCLQHRRREGGAESRHVPVQAELPRERNGLYVHTFLGIVILGLTRYVEYDMQRMCACLEHALRLSKRPRPRAFSFEIARMQDLI